MIVKTEFCNLAKTIWRKEILSFLFEKQESMGLLLSYHLYHQKTSFVNSFYQKVVFVASYICLASRGRQKWYSWYSLDAFLPFSKNTAKTLLLWVPSFFIPFKKTTVLVGYNSWLLLSDASWANTNFFSAAIFVYVLIVNRAIN